MDFGFSIPSGGINATPEIIARLARRGEELGFAYIGIPDHIVIPNNVLDSTTFSHPIFSIQTHKAQKELNKIQGIKNTYFCGSYCGYGFHEDGIQSAAYIAELLNITLPWQREHNFKSRLNYSQ